MDHGRFGWDPCWVLGWVVNLSDKIGFTKSWFSVYSPAEYCFSYNTYEVFGIVRRNVYHNDRADMFRPDVCLLATYSKPENRTRS
jgi:hypothetical protein